MHNYPWYRAWQERFADKNVTIIGIHTPETAGETKVDRVRAKVKENQIKYPVAIDNKFDIWKAWNNNFWPAIYLVDKKGQLRYRWDGELHFGNVKGEPIMRKKIEELLAEKE